MKSTKLPSWIERLLGLDPLPAPPHVFAIDSEAIRYGSVRRGQQGFIFEAYRVETLEPGLLTDGVTGATVGDRAALAATVKGFVGGLPGPFKEASLLLPDTWLRLLFAELEELPTKRQTRDDILRWKLERLVPYAVDDLRISAVSIAPLPDQAEPVRVLLGFAPESLVGPIESAFAEAGVTLGQITNVTLAALTGVTDQLAEGEVAALVLAAESGYTISMVRDGEPLLYRYKELAGEMAVTQRAATVRRDLRLTASFARERLGSEPARVFVAAPHALEPEWLTWLDDELGVASEPLGNNHLNLGRVPADLPWDEVAAMYGAAASEVF
ncbi:MAG: hypothetical protein AAGD38_04145 [Acidobacteriota bacterium]